MFWVVEIIKGKLLKLPKHGVFGYHPSKLPFNKGRHPINGHWLWV